MTPKRDLIDREFATIGDMKKPDSSDKLIQETIELKIPMHLDTLQDREQTEYIHQSHF